MKQITANGLQVKLSRVVPHGEMTPERMRLAFPGQRVTYDGRLWTTVGSSLTPVVKTNEVDTGDSLYPILSLVLPSYRWTITLENRCSKDVPNYSTEFDWTGFEEVL